MLPTLAEASPERFLDAVDTELDSGGLSAVFDPEAERSRSRCASAQGQPVDSKRPQIHPNGVVAARYRLARARAARTAKSS